MVWIFLFKRKDVVALYKKKKYFFQYYKNWFKCKYQNTI